MLLKGLYSLRHRLLLCGLKSKMLTLEYSLRERKESILTQKDKIFGGFILAFDDAELQRNSEVCFGKFVDPLSTRDGICPIRDICRRACLSQFTQSSRCL